ncbi:MAG TPA: translation initiation factor IF-2 [Oculatellaceae cyanobacterium]
MNDRVRIYELARQMNLENEDIITALRELGYDVKSHSSTIDKTAVGLLIQHIGKKRQQAQEKTKATTAKIPAAAGKAAPKAAPPPPAPVKAKPRVLNRYRPEPVGETPDPNAAAAPAATSTPTPGNGQVTAPVEIAEKVAPTPTASTPTPQALAPSQPATTASASAAATATPVATPQPAAKEATPLPAEPVETAKQPEPQAKPPQPEQKSTTPNVEEEDKGDEEKEEERYETENVKSEREEDVHPRGQAVRPMTPSVPVRIAAPSVRATPHRPQKTHRQTPAERHSNQQRKEDKRPAAAPVEVPKIITLTTNLTVKELSEKMGVAVEEIIKRMMTKGVLRTVNQLVELELAKDLATEMEYEVLTEEFAETPEQVESQPELTEEEQAALITRPPVVTIMGHVDHGKTSLLDAIRQTKFLLTDAEAGGITQHIGAYHVEVKQKDGPDRQIVFLDTPGHEAFTAMRARGAKATDIAILVVAADDGVMPQTIEAIDHVKAAGVPLVVAVNKIDKAGADPDRVLTQLMEHGVLSDKYGGDTVTCNVSAKKRQGLEELLEMILLVADILDLKANPDKLASGVIIEAEKSRQKGAVVTALVENGTLYEGNLIVAGIQSGKVRALSDDHGRRVKAAGPSMPVEVLGLDEVPGAGDRFEVCADLAAVKALVEKNRLAYGDRKSQHVTLESLHDLLERGEVRDLNVIVKADVQGTAEAIAESIRKLSGNEVQVRVLRTASGDISENDVNLAASSNAIVIGFNVQPDMNAKNVAEANGVDIRTYSIIYQITDDLEKAIQGLIQPLRQELHIGTAEVRQIFKFGKNLTIAGCMVTAGKVQRGSIAKIDRGGQIVHEGKLDTLKRFKDDAREVAQGFECGMSFEKFSDLQEGDKVHCYIIEEKKREITRS